MPVKLLWKHQSEELVIFSEVKEIKNEGLVYSEAKFTGIKCFVLLVGKSLLFVTSHLLEKGKKKVCSPFLMVRMNYCVCCYY